jgi:hypothetical protein
MEKRRDVLRQLIEMAYRGHKDKPYEGGRYADTHGRAGEQTSSKAVSGQPARASLHSWIATVRSGRTANGEIPHKSTGVAIVAPCGGGGRKTTAALIA